MHRALLLSLLFTTSIPDTPAGKQLAGWLAVFARGDQQAFTRFFTERFSEALLKESPADHRSNRVSRTWVDTRGFEVRKIEESTADEIVVLAQSSLTDLWFRLTVKVEPDPPHRITQYVSQRIQPPAGSSKKLSQRELVKEIAAFVKKTAAADAFSGTILVARDGKPIYSVARGWASLAYQYPNRLDTRFSLASVGKNFTAVAIVQLVEQGKLSFTDPVGKFLADYPSQEVREKVTIHHLLTHTSGLGELYSPKYVCVKGALRQVRDYFPLFTDNPKPLAFEPGARWDYSNIGYIILGAIIERVTGENYFDYIRTHVFKPARMRDTDYYEIDIDTPNVATGYTNFIDLGNNEYDFLLGQRRNTTLMATVKGNPQGGAFSTAGDLLNYISALRSHTLVSERSLDLMTTVKVESRKMDAGQTYWGYGFELETIDGQRIIGHTGGDFGVSSTFRMYPDSGNYTVIVLSNYDRGGQIAIFKLQELILFGKS